MITRADYQRNRFAFLTGLTDVKKGLGLEIGAGDLPTVLPGAGRCLHANMYGKRDLVTLFNLPAEQVPEVNYVVSRRQPLSEQIGLQTFDYVFLAHVIEHVADPIGYVKDLTNLLRQDALIVMAVPDKRRTFDNPRPATAIEHILSDYHERAMYPSVEHIMQFAPCIIDELKGKDSVELYQWAQANHESGAADVHCHVWTDEDFFRQVDEIRRAGLWTGLTVVAKWPNSGDFNEFMIALRYTGGR
jgi:SAM-dependent methyltransferase